MKPIEELNITIKKDNIIDGIMKSNGLYCLVAEPKVGKSFLALQLANSLVNNKQFLGFNTNPTILARRRRTPCTGACVGQSNRGLL